jgi:transposase-like protein
VIRYTDDQKRQAVEHARQAITNGATLNKAVAAAAETIGTTPPSVRRWAKQAGIQLGDMAADRASRARKVHQDHYAAKRLELRLVALQRAFDMLERMETGTAIDARNLAVAFGILVDKIRLEEGEATERTERVTAEWLDSEIKRLTATMNHPSSQH